MSKKTKSTSTKKGLSAPKSPLPPDIQNQIDKEVQNSFAGAIGFSSTGFPANQGAPGTEQISNVNTLYKNLRWYLVSNFRQLLSECYVEIGLIQTIVDVPVDDAFRGGIEIKSKQLDEDQIEELQISIDRDDNLNTVAQACKWNRLFGGAAILVLVGDQDPMTPLDLTTLTKDTPFEFRAADMWEISNDTQNTQGYDPSTQSQEYDYYMYYGEKIHKSRVMRLKGFEAPSFIRPRLRGWGMSVVEVLVRSINQYLKATDLGYEVLDEFKIDVYKIKNLTSTLLSQNGEDKMRRRMQMTNYLKNYQNAIVMDSEDDYDHKQLSFAGLAEAMTGIRMQVASDLRMPITKLFGQSVSGGLGNTDQNDMENYNSMVEAQVRNKIKYDILRVIEIKCQVLFGMIPDDLSISFKPLRVLSAEQEENVKTQKFTRLLQARQAGELTTLEFRDAANKGNLFDISLDNSGDELNPDDPEVTDLVAEGSKDEEVVDTDDEGSGRAATEKPKATDVGGAGKDPVEKKENVLILPKRYNRIERMERILQNSLEYDKAAYQADGGDGWIDPRRAKLLLGLATIDHALLSKAKEASQKTFGRESEPFIAWFYKKHGGKFQ